MKRGHVKVLLALGFTILVAGTIFFGLGRSQGSSNAIRATRPDSAQPIDHVGQATAAVTSAVTRVSVARPYHVRALRTMAPRRAQRITGPAEDEGAYALAPSRTTADGALQRSPGRGMPAPLRNFDGLSNINGALRPDTSGDVGPNHYMQWTNLSFAIYNKQGSMVYGPAAGTTLFPNSSVCGTHNGGDPVILYDQFANRWFATQSAYANLVDGPYYQCVAVSRTSDPTGAWCSYQFLSHTTKFTDYAKFGVWPSQNAYMMTSPQYYRAASFSGIGVWALERNQLLSCGNARIVYRDMVSQAPDLPRMLPADADGSLAPPAGAAAPLMTMNWNGSGLQPNTLQLWNANVNWAGNASLTMSHVSDIQTAAYDSNLCNYARSCISQPGTTAKVDALADRLMYRLAYRNFGTSQAMVVNHTVDVGNDQAGIRWYQLSKSGTGPWGIAQQGTYAPDNTNRFMGSAAMDRMGDVAIGYSVSDGVSTNPGVRYAGRLATDPAGQLSQGEQTLVNGTGVQTQGTSHWGDYSMMSVDPSDDCTFWYGQEYYSETGAMNWHTRIGSFRFPNCASIHNSR
jgi:hypothetical protein